MNKPSHEYCKDCKDWNDNITNCFEICGIPIDIMKEWEKYRSIGTVEECRTAVEKQKEMIAYCDENDCADCLFYNATKKYNKCMNDFIAEEIEKGGVVNE